MDLENIEIHMDDIKKELERTKFTVEEYAIIDDKGIKCMGDDLMGAYREYNKLVEPKKIIYGKINKGYFMGMEWIINHEVIKTIK